MSKNQTESKPPSVEEPTDEGLDATACCASFSPRNLHITRKVIGGDVGLRVVSDDGAQVDNLTAAEVAEVGDALRKAGLRIFGHNAKLSHEEGEIKP